MLFFCIKQKTLELKEGSVLLKFLKELIPKESAKMDQI